jgi:hypothetical protein
MTSVPHSRHRLTDRRALGATAGSFILLAGIAMSPLAAPRSVAEERAEYIATHAQAFRVPASAPAAAAATSLDRDSFGVTPGAQTFIAGGTNHDWAKLVLLYAGWPITDNNVTVLTRWMRQENGADSWWTRNNPLNIGAGGFAAYTSLDQSAQVVARALTTNSGYAGIASGFASSADPAVTEYAIWASPWAGGHYAWGGHWHYTPVDVVSAPRSAWGS